MNTIQPNQLIDSLHWRYATKQFDSARKIPANEWTALEDTLVLTPSSFGLQPWKFVIVQDQPLRESLVPHTWGQKQPVECSHYVVLCVKTTMGETEIDAFLKRTIEIRGGTLDQLAGYRGMMVGSLVQGPLSQRVHEWATRQVYIALGNLMTSAAVLGIDACPMEGFDSSKYDELLGLEKLGLKSVVCCALGYRASTDKYASLAKVRFAKSDVIIHK